MQDEVTKHTRKIFSVMKNVKQSFSGKVKEITIEIFIIVFAVTVSIWMHSWSQHVHQQQEVKEFLADVKDDIKDNIRIMTNVKMNFSDAISNFSYLEKLDEKRYDSIAKTPQGEDIISKKLSINITIRKYTNANYEGFKSSGKIGYIENKKLKKLLLAYYQKDIPALIDIDSYFNTKLAQIIDCLADNIDKPLKEQITNSKTNLRISLALNAAKGSKHAYEEVMNNAKKILAEIDKELQE